MIFSKLVTVSLFLILCGSKLSAQAQNSFNKFLNSYSSINLSINLAPISLISSSIFAELVFSCFLSFVGLGLYAMILTMHSTKSMAWVGYFFGSLSLIYLWTNSGVKYLSNNFIHCNEGNL